MKIFYVSLVRSLLGYYVKFKAPNIDIVREHVYKYYGKLWCSVYTEKPTGSKVSIINEDKPIVLTSSEWE